MMINQLHVIEFINRWIAPIWFINKDCFSLIDNIIVLNIIVHILRSTSLLFFWLPQPNRFLSIINYHIWWCFLSSLWLISCRNSRTSCLIVLKYILIICYLKKLVCLMNYCISYIRIYFLKINNIHQKIKLCH